MKRPDRKRRRFGWLLLVLAVLIAMPIGQAAAMDPATAKAYCHAVKQAAQDAEKGYVQVYTMKTDPQQVFHDATASCMSRILDYQLNLPSMDGWIAAMNGILKRMAEKLMNQMCQAASDQFHKAVRDAQDTINDATEPANDFGVEAGLGGLDHTTIRGNGEGDVTVDGNPVGRVVNPVSGQQ